MSHERMIAQHRRPVRIRLAAIAFAAALVTAPALLLAGAATAEDDPWAGSGFDETFDLTESSTLDEITGVFQRENVRITEVGPGEDDGYITGDKLDSPGCDVSDAAASITEGFGTDRASFLIEPASIEDEPFEFPCNGAYQVAITGSATRCLRRTRISQTCVESETVEKTLRAPITVAVPPVAARNVAASVLAESGATSSTTQPDDDGIEDVLRGAENPNASPASAAGAQSSSKASVEVTWRFPSQPEPDATYIVQRAGPSSGTFKPVSDVLDADNGDDGALIDTVSFSGTYDYRVLAVRPAATDNEKVTTASKVVSVEVTGLPDPPNNDDGDDDGNGGGGERGGNNGIPGLGSSTGGSIPHLDGSGRGGSARGRVSPPTRPTVTTLDTGYDDTLDYGDLAEPGELAAEGQSIIRNRNIDGPAIVPAIAGGLVLLGWAGHAFYLSRLARQF